MTGRISVLLLTLILVATPWLLCGTSSAADLPAGLSPAKFKVLDTMLDSALAAYNSSDGKKFCADFVPTMLPKTAAELDNFGKFYTMKARDQFGSFKSKTLNAKLSGTSHIEDGAQSYLCYNVQMEKGPAFLYATVNTYSTGMKFVSIDFRDKPATDE